MNKFQITRNLKFKFTFFKNTEIWRPKDDPNPSLEAFKVSFDVKDTQGFHSYLKSQKEAQIQILEKEEGGEENCSANMQNT